MNNLQQRSSSKRTRRGKRSRRGRSPSPRPGCINAALSATPAPAPQQQPSRPHTGNSSNSNSNNSAGGADSVRRRTPTPPTTTGRTSPMTTSARRIMGGVHVGGTPGSFVPPHLRPAGAVTGSSGGRRGLVRRTHSPKTVVSDRYLLLHVFACMRYACLAGLFMFCYRWLEDLLLGSGAFFRYLFVRVETINIGLKMPKYWCRHVDPDGSISLDPWMETTRSYHGAQFSQSMAHVRLTFTGAFTGNLS